jgi:hypothetical protein
VSRLGIEPSVAPIVAQKLILADNSALV